MRSALLIACLACATALRADDLDTFARNDLLIGKESFRPGNAAIEGNLAILTRALMNASPGEAKKVLARYDEVAKKNDDGYATSFSWVGGSKVEAGNLSIVCVNYGPVGHVRITDRHGELAIPKSLQFVDRRSPQVLYAKGDVVVIASHFVRDAGMHDNTKLDFLHINGARVRVEETVTAEHMLDWGGATVRGGRIAVDSLDAPKSFSAYSQPYLKHRRLFSVSGQLLKDEPQDNALRAVDTWLRRAQLAKRRNARQKAAAAVLPEAEPVDLVKIAGSTIILAGDRGSLRFELKTERGRYSVVSVGLVR